MVSNLLLGGSLGSSPQTGFKVLPFGFLDYSGDGASAIVKYHLSATQAMVTDDSVAVIVGFAATGGVGNGTLASNISVHFMMQGFVVSVPFAYH